MMIFAVILCYYSVPVKATLEEPFETKANKPNGSVIPLHTLCYIVVGDLPHSYEVTQHFPVQVAQTKLKHRPLEF